MSTKALIGILAAVVIVLGGAWYFMSDGTTDTPQENGTENTNTSSNTPGGQQAAAPSGRGSGTFADLIGRTGNYRCTFDSAVENSETSGTIYVTSGRMRGDFVTNAEGTRIESHMVRQGGFIYTWTNLSTQGFKLKDTTQAGTGTSSAGGQNQSIDTSLKLTYDCAPWIVDTRLLDIPSNITFTTP